MNKVKKSLENNIIGKVCDALFIIIRFTKVHKILKGGIKTPIAD